MLINHVLSLSSIIGWSVLLHSHSRPVLLKLIAGQNIDRTRDDITQTHRLIVIALISISKCTLPSRFLRICVLLILIGD